MSIEELEEKKLEVEIRKLLAEEEKAREEIRHLKLPAFLNPKVIVALLVAIIGLAATGGKLYLTTIERDQAIVNEIEAVAQEEATEAFAQNLKKENIVLAQEARSTGSVVTRQPSAIIKFRGSITRKQISGLQLFLNNSNFVAPRPFRTSVIEATEVVYFDKSDSDIADSLKDYTVKYFKDLECPFHSPINVVKKESDKYKKGSVIVFVYHKCG